MKKLAIGLVVAAFALSAVGVYAQGLPLPQISVAPASYDFGNVPVGALASGNLLVTNTGGGTLIVTAVKTKDPFSDGATSFQLKAGKSRRVRIALAPPAVGQYNSVCTFLSNAANGSTLNVPLAGTGVQ